MGQSYRVMEITSGYIGQVINNALDQSAAAKIQSGIQDLSNADVEEIASVAKDFEAVFLTQMIQHMFADIETNTLFGGGHGEDVAKSMLFDEYGKAISKSGGIGIAEQVQKELMRLQEGAVARSPSP